MEDNEALKEFIKQKAYRDIIIKYMFVKSMEKQYSDKYIDMKYKLNSAIIRKKYELLEESYRESVENSILEQINSGKIDLRSEAAAWHKAALKKEANARKNRNGKEEREEL